MDSAGTAPLLTAEQRRVTRICLAILGALGSGSLIALAVFPTLTSRAPLLLVAMSPLARWIVLVSPRVDPVALGVVVVLRRMLFYGATYQLGRSLGPAGIRWLEERAARFARFVRFVERIFEIAPHTVLLFLAGPTTCALAGISGMRPVVFLPLALASTTFRVVAIVWFADWVSAYTEIALEWIDRYWLPATAATLGAVALYQWRQRRRAPAELGAPERSVE